MPTSSRSESCKQLVAARISHGGPAGLTPAGYVSVDGLPRPIPRQCSAIRTAILAVGNGSTLTTASLILAKGGVVGRNGKPLSRSATRHVVTNPFYAGFVRHKGQLFPGRHEAIVDGESVGQALYSLMSRTRKC